MSLGLQISIRKLSDDGVLAEYSYGTRGNDEGMVRLRRATGEVELIRASSDDGQGLLFSRVAAKLKKHWHDGEVPAKTRWAS
jgi:hypothetical protein